MTIKAPCGWVSLPGPGVYRAVYYSGNVSGQGGPASGPGGRGRGPGGPGGGPGGSGRTLTADPVVSLALPLLLLTPSHHVSPAVSLPPTAPPTAPGARLPAHTLGKH